VNAFHVVRDGALSAPLDGDWEANETGSREIA